MRQGQGAARAPSLRVAARRLGLGDVEPVPMGIGALRIPSGDAALFTEVLHLAHEDATEEKAGVRRWAAEKMQQPRHRALILSSSRALARSWEGGQQDDAASLSILRYLLRASTRCTPFGVLARVAGARFSQEASWPEPRTLPFHIGGLEPNDKGRARLATGRILSRRGNRIVALDADTRDEATLEFHDELWRHLRGVDVRERKPLVQQLVLKRLLERYPRPELRERIVSPDLLDSFTGATSVAITESVLLPDILQQELAHRALALLACQTVPPHIQRLQAYHARFRERFSEEWVCVADLADPLVCGLAAPWETPVEEDRQRDDARRSWLMDLYRRGLQSPDGVELSDEEIARFSAPASAGAPLANGFEVGCLVHASSHEALSRGEYTLAPSGFPGSGEPFRSLGRFLWCLPESLRDEVLAYQRALEREGDAVHAEIVWARNDSQLPLRWAPHGWSSEVVCNGPPRMSGRRLLRPEDVMVRASTHGFCFALRDGQPLVLHQGHMLAARGSPRIARLMLELSTDGRRTPRGFDWQELAGAPRLPRLRWRNHILSFARWRIDDGRLGEDVSPTAIRRWREEQSVPRLVCLTDQDRKLPIDLDAHWGRGELLRARKQSSPSLYIEEAPWAEHWTPDTLLAEVIPSITLRTGSDLRPKRSRPVSPQQPLYREWRYFSIFADELAQLRTLKMLRPLLGGGPLHWHYVRYQEGHRQQVRVRWRGECPLDRFEAVLELALACGATDVRQEVFRPEVSRYGGPRALDAALRFFTWDSDAALLTWDKVQDVDALVLETAAVIADVFESLLGCEQGAAACRLRPHSAEVAARARRLREERGRLELHVRAPPRALAERLGRWASLTEGGAPDLEGARAFAHMAANRRMGARRELESAALAVAETILQARKRAGAPARLNNG